jgi:hypothetical protein
MNGPPRKQVLEQLDALQREIAEYHRYLAEFPAVCRVLENLSLRIEGPLPGAEQTRYRSVSNLREELRNMRAADSAYERAEPQPAVDEAWVARAMELVEGYLTPSAENTLRLHLSSTIAAPQRG